MVNGGGPVDLLFPLGLSPGPPDLIVHARHLVSDRQATLIVKVGGQRNIAVGIRHGIRHDHDPRGLVVYMKAFL